MGKMKITTAGVGGRNKKFKRFFGGIAMKRKNIFVVLMVLLLALPVFAADPGSGSWTNSGAIDKDTSDQNATLLATFDMDGESVIADKVNIGFTADSLSDDSFTVSSKPNMLQSVSLADKAGDGVATSTDVDHSTINAYAIITSADPLYVSLSIDKALTDDASHYLGWTVKWNDGSEKSIHVEGSDSVTKSSQLFYTHTPSVKVGSAGFETITIETDNYTGLPTGSYYGYVTISVSTDNPVTV